MLKFNCKTPTFWCLAAGFIVAIASLAYRIDAIGIWHDEGFSYLIALSSLKDILTATQRYVVAPPLWYLLVKLDLWMTGGVPWTVRLPSLLAYGAVIGIAGYWAKEWGRNRWALITMWFIGFSPMVHFYAQSGRFYATLALLYLMMALFTERYLKQPEQRSPLVGVAITSLLALYLHNYAVMLVASLNLVFFIQAWHEKRDRKCVYAWLVAQAVVIVLYLPWLSMFLQHTQKVEANSFLKEVWQAAPWYQQLLRSLQNFVPGGARYSYPPQANFWGMQWIPLSIAALFVIASRPWKYSRQTLYLGLLCFVPLLLVLLYSMLLSPVYVPGRTEAMVAPFFFLFFVSAAIETRPKWIGYSSVALLTVIGCFTMFGFHHAERFELYRQKSDRQTLDYIFRQEQPELLILGSNSSAALMSLIRYHYPEQKVLLYPGTTSKLDKKWTDHFLSSAHLRLDKRARFQTWLDAVDVVLGKTEPKSITLVFRSFANEGETWAIQQTDLTLFQHLYNQWGYQHNKNYKTFPIANMVTNHLVLEMRPHRPQQHSKQMEPTP